MAGNKIPVGEVVGSSLNFAWDNFGSLLRIGWFPLLASGIFSLAAQYPAEAGSGTLISPEVDLILIPGSFFLSYLLWAVFAVAVHRIILLDQDAPPDLLYFRLTGEELRYSVAPFLISIVPIAIIFGAFALALGPELILSAVEADGTPVPVGEEEASQLSGASAFLIFIAFAVAIPFAIFVGMRLTMVLPGIVDKGRYAVRHAWAISKGNVWRLIGVQFLLSFAFTVLFAAFALVIAIVVGIVASVGVPLTEGGEMTGTLIGTIITGIGFFFFIVFLGTVAGIAILSYSYQALTEDQGAPPDMSITPSDAI